jgi:hypothetical protein
LRVGLARTTTTNRVEPEQQQQQNRVEPGTKWLMPVILATQEAEIGRMMV